MSPRLQGLGHVLRQQPYEAAIAAAMAVSSVESLRSGATSRLAARVLPAWALHPAGALLGFGGALSLVGLLCAGYVLGDVRRVLARRVEQAGQALMAGVLFAIAVGAFTAGPAGTAAGAVYAALAAASGGRSALIGHLFNSAGRERTDLAP